ncbi:Gfo/Idh/MocA family protein [Microbacterium elymi]|uniref:Gfo/Idh/MocA family oxidoreductase n=1 Tax=Microbacterium elymi TaxID=2909587 RepID=A0ABY5NLR0_9MICO|nr:Gfo/Idh/MocA family oxidoreductase [Microbacterium elymi]UUT36125.1 Gfo/Idh/MocA family oxidoreductase [Microbacterium elymi]
MTVGVGVMGAGPGAAALHLPTIAHLSPDFAIVHISDGGSGRAQGLATGTGARFSAGEAQLLADPAVDVIAICSPVGRHADQILQSVAAGKRAILCEKPIAMTHADADAVVAACREAGTMLVVGTNHHFDPAWARAKHHLVAAEARVHTVAVTIALPPNGRYHDVVTQLAPDMRSAQRPRPDWDDPAFAAAVVRELVLGLGIHDLPALRDLAPRLTRVVYARPVPPIGYAIGLRAGDVLVQLTALMLPGGPDARWRMSIGTGSDMVDVDFPPAFVHAGSASVRVYSDDGKSTEYPRDAEDGYVAEWRALLAAIERSTPVEYDEILHDAHFAIDIADAAADAVRHGVAR